MPAGFDRCVKARGSRVRTMTLSKGRFRRICFSGGKSFLGEIKKKKKGHKGKKKR